MEEDAGSYQEKYIICSSLNGKAVSITEALDEALSSKAVGDGYMVIPASGQVLTPEGGEVLFVFPSKYTIGLETEDGMEYLLHIGVNTVKLDGKGSETSVKDGQKVKKGQKLMEFGPEYIRTSTASGIYMAVFTGLVGDREVHMVRTGEARALDEIGWH